MNRKSQATIVLIVMTAGTLLTVNNTCFTGGLIHNGFMAAMIGGLADWFAITAIFKKPLGISWRTAILPRNRQRIMDEIITFIGEDLLNTANIMKNIIQYDMSKMFIIYLEKLGGRKRLKETVQPILIGLLQNFDSNRLAAIVQKIIKKDKQEYILKDTLIQVSSHLTDELVFAKLMEISYGISLKILNDEKTQAVFEPVIHEIKEEYKKGSTLREMIIAMFDLSDENLINIIKKNLITKLEHLKDSESDEYKAVFDWLQNLLAGLPQNKKYDDFFKTVEDELIYKINITAYLKNYIDNYKNNDTNAEYVIGMVNHIVDDAINAFIQNTVAHESFDNWLKEKLSLFVTKSSPFILQMVRDKLNSYSTESFITLIENHVGNDLQMIRINGSLVGGIAGMLLYMLTYFAERMLG